jgi:D-glycero-D-manno-heptose 1,7-bisphosphate phosphatase
MAVTPLAPDARSNQGGLRTAVFLDKDGTLIEDVPYNVDPDLIRLTDGALDGLRALHDAGYLLIVVSNQSGIARGYFEEQALGAVERQLRDLLGGAGAPLAGFYYCPHHPDGCIDAYGVECECRKPAPGLLSRAARDHGVNLARSWMIGDILHDVEAGRRAGCRTILLDVGHETEWELTPAHIPDFTVANLDAAARLIINVDGESQLRVGQHPAHDDRPTAGASRR